MLRAAGAGNLQALLGQLNQAGQIKHRSFPAIPIAGPALMGQIKHRSSPASINAGPINATEGSHEMDSSERPPVEDRPIFQTGSKRRCCMDTESDDEEEDKDQKLQAEMFDPDSLYKHSKKLKLPQSIEHYVNTHFHSCLSNSVRKAMAADNPLPNIPALTAPIEDHVIMDYMGGAFPAKPNTQLKCLQSTVIAAAAPTLNLWAALEEQEVTTAQGGLIPVEVVLECFQKTLVLLGSASSYMSLNHRDIIIRKISQKSKGLGRFMNSVYKESKPEGTQLFGTVVQKAITERAETMSALSKTASKTYSSGDCKKFFQGGPTSGCGSV